VTDADARATATTSLAQDVKNPTHKGPGGYTSKIAGAAIAVKTPPAECVIVISLRDAGTDQHGQAADGPGSQAWPAVGAA
jgi:hypothetical protein